jgi:hypothetical protein
MPAATSAPNATSRISSVSGSDSVRAWAKSLLKASLSALVELASPAWAIRKLGCVRCAAAVAQRRSDAAGGVVRAARDLKADQHRMAVRRDLASVGRDVRRTDVLDRAQPRQSRDEITDRGLERRVCGSERAALHEHLLVRRLWELRVQHMARAT